MRTGCNYLVHYKHIDASLHPSHSPITELFPFPSFLEVCHRNACSFALVRDQIGGFITALSSPMSHAASSHVATTHLWTQAVLSQNSWGVPPNISPPPQKLLTIPYSLKSSQGSMHRVCFAVVLAAKTTKMQSTTFDNLAGDDCLLSLVNAICDKNMKPGFTVRTDWIGVCIGIKANSSLEFHDEGSENEAASASLSSSSLFMSNVGISCEFPSQGEVHLVNTFITPMSGCEERSR